MSTQLGERPAGTTTLTSATSAIRISRSRVNSDESWFMLNLDRRRRIELSGLDGGKDKGTHPADLDRARSCQPRPAPGRASPAGPGHTLSAPITNQQPPTWPSTLLNQLQLHHEFRCMSSHRSTGQSQLACHLTPHSVQSGLTMNVLRVVQELAVLTSSARSD